MKRKLIVKIKGGTANQLIQYSVANAIAIRTNRELIIDVSDYYYNCLLQKLKKNTVFSLSKILVNDNVSKTYLPICDIKAGLVSKDKIFTSRANSYDSLNKILNSNKRNIYLNGYFHQSEFTELIDTDFLFSKLEDCVSDISKIKHAEILASNYVSLHIRRGDYLKQKFNDSHGLCDINYFKSAIGTVKDLDNYKVAIFSDDIKWSVDSFKYLPHIVYGLGNNALEDLYLMTACNVNIISNSSFSWLAALLNRNEDKMVISPEQWFKIAPNNAVLNIGTEIFVKNELV